MSRRVSHFPKIQGELKDEDILPIVRQGNWRTSLEDLKVYMNKDGGADGKSAYQVWLDAGNTGSVEDYLESLKGEKGATGLKGDKGDIGDNGMPGKSAYQIWLDEGNTGTESDYINSLKGENGIGVPPGGVAGQILSKKSADSYDFEWKDNAADNVPETTDDLPEGDTNKYFSDAAAKAALATDISTLQGAINTEAGLREAGDEDILLSLSGKVDKVAGKGLSTEDYTPAEKQKLAEMESSKYRGEYASLAALELAHPVGEPGWYADVDAGPGADVVRYIWDGSDQSWVSQKGTSTADEPVIKDIAARGFHGIASGTNTYTVSIPEMATLKEFQTIKLLFPNGCTGASNLNVNGWGALPMKRPSGSDLAQDDIRSGGVYELTHIAGVFQVMGSSASVIPKVLSGERVVTQKADGTHVDYDLKDALTYSPTTAQNLDSAVWTGETVTLTGTVGEVRYSAGLGWKYECFNTNIWRRSPYNLGSMLFILGGVNDSGGVKTSIEMSTLYPNAIVPQIVTGTAGIYQFFGLNGWFYFENKIAI